MESGKILDKQITASSEWDALHAAHQGRLNFQEVVEGGVAKKVRVVVSSHKRSKSMAASRLAPSRICYYKCSNARKKQAFTLEKHNQWVKSYKLQYSNNGVDFEYYKDARQNSAKVRLKMASIYRKRRSQAASSYKYMEIGQKVEIS